MDVAFTSAPGSAEQENEDWVGATAQAVVVLDGLSAPAGFESGCVHGTVWFVRQLGSRLLHLASADADTALYDHLARAIEDVADLHADTCELDHLGTPSATVAMLRLRSDQADWLVLSDALVVLDTAQGIEVHTDPSVDHAAVEERAAVLRERIGTPAHDAARRATVAAQRPRRNVEGGYWIAAGNPHAAAHSLTGTVPTVGLRRAAVLSDGAAALVDLRGVEWAAVLDLLGDRGPDQLIERIRKTEANDPDGTRWPRYKTSDDATVALCTF